MRFKDLSIKSKLMSGFMLMTVIIAIFGVTAFIYIGKISGSLFSITDNYAKVVEYATGVERTGLTTIMEVKNYFLKEKEESRQRVENNLAELNKFLDKVDKLAKEYNNKELLEGSKSARAGAQQYAVKYREGVKAVAENKKSVETMIKSGNIVEKAADTFLTMQVEAYTNAQKKGALTSELDGYVQRYIITTNIYEHALKIMRAEKQEVNYKDRTAYNTMLTLLPELMQLYDTLEKITTGPKELQLILDARQATKVYENAAATWIKNDNNLKNILVDMHKFGSIVIKQAQKAT
ncbi:MAG TPA: methyl-accepting chemotaxis protein, partial [Desulfobacterales bacterium]|nr:methyl-accepting chemotaxis protein [Desulfobacterales bacterium]